MSLAVEEGIFITAQVNSIEVRFLIDTGSTTTLVSNRAFEQLPESQRPELTGTKTRVVLADGKVLPTSGYATLTLTFGKISVDHEVLIAGIGVTGLLGMDFLRAFNCQLNLPKNTIQIRGCTFPLNEVKTDFQCCRIQVLKHEVILPNTEQIIMGSPESGAGDLPELGLVAPLQAYSEKHQLAVARALVSLKESKVPVRVMNASDAEVHLYPGTSIALCQSIDEVLGNSEDSEVCNLVQGGGVNTSQFSESVPDHLSDMFIRACQHLDIEQQNKVKSLIVECKEVFANENGDLGRTKLVTHKINVGNAQPIRQAPRRLPLHQREVATKEIESMLEKDIIRPSSSPWSSPIVLVKKKDGTIRFCIDYRKLNAITIKDAYPIPNIQESLEMLSGACWYSTLDLASGYWQVSMDDKDREKTAFITRDGLYEFNVMAMGLCNSPSTFERLMERTLAGLNQITCLVYLDDIVIFGKDVEEKIHRLREVFRRLIDAGLKLKPKKCILFQESVKYLGHIVSKNGIATDPDKVKSIQEWPTPENVSQLRSFLGLSSYYRRYVKGFASIARSLHKLTELDRQFVWTKETEESFQELKKRLVTAPILGYPNAQDPFVLDTDASGYALGAVLSQIQNGEERVIAYASRALSRPERSYCVTRRELLAAVTFIKYFRHYLYGKRFLLRTDHGSLRWLFNFKSPEGQLARWLEVLGTYDFEIQHRPGLKHSNCDSLSRHPCHQCGRVADEQNDEGAHIVALSQVTEKEAPNWLPVKSQEELIEAQSKDNDIALILDWKQKNQKPIWADISQESGVVKTYWAQWDTLVIKDGLLYRKWPTVGRTELSWQLVVPASMKPEILYQLHDSPMAGHLGVKRVLASLRQRFFWPFMKKDVLLWCAKCKTCARKKDPKRAHKAALQQYQVGEVLDRVALDVLGPLPSTQNGNRYVLVVAEYFTKWVECYPIPNQEAVTVAAKLVNEFCVRFGVPRQIITDQGSNFESKLFSQLCTMLHIDKTRTSSYRPQSDGFVERQMRTIQQLLSKYVSENQTDWDKHLPILMAAYRATPQDSTQVTPNLMMLGRQVSLPIDLVFGRPPGSGGEKECIAEYCLQLEESFRTAHTYARKHLGRSAARQKRNYDKNIYETSLTPGTLVWLNHKARTKGRSPKLSYAWDGPFIVRRKISGVNYEIQRGSMGKLKIVHLDRLKPYVGMEEEPPSRDTVPASSLPGKKIAESGRLPLRGAEGVSSGKLAERSTHGGHVGENACTPPGSSVNVYSKYGRRIRAPKKYMTCS